MKGLFTVIGIFTYSHCLVSTCLGADTKKTTVIPPQPPSTEVEDEEAHSHFLTIPNYSQPYGPPMFDSNAFSDNYTSDKGFDAAKESEESEEPKD